MRAGHLTFVAAGSGPSTSGLSMTAPKHFLDILGLGRRPLEHRRVPMNERWELGTGVRALNGRVWVEPVRLDFRALRQVKGVFDVNAEVADGVFDLGMPEKNLDSTQIAGRLVVDRSLGAPKRCVP